MYRPVRGICFSILRYKTHVKETESCLLPSRRDSVKYTFLTSVFLGKLLSHRSYCINPIIGFIEEGKMRFTISIFSVFMLCLSIMEMWHLKLLNIFQFYSLQGRKLGLCELTILCIISQRENNCGRVLHLRKHFATCTNIHNDGKLV